MRRLSLVLTALVVAACATQPTLNTAPDAARSFDGLYRLENTVVDEVWARGDLDLSGYARVKLEGAGIQYRPARPARRTTIDRSRSAQEGFPISAADRERLRATFHAAFTEELGKLQRYTLTDEVGPHVLVVRAQLLDVVSNVPPEPMGRGNVFLTSVGEATLVIELVDSESNTVLLRVKDRREAEAAGGRPFDASTVRNWFEVERLAQSWATRLRNNLDALAERLILTDDPAG